MNITTSYSHSSIERCDGMLEILFTVDLQMKTWTFFLLSSTFCAVVCYCWYRLPCTCICIYFFCYIVVFSACDYTFYFMCLLHRYLLSIRNKKSQLCVSDLCVQLEIMCIYNLLECQWKSEKGKYI